jgi:hypothetical protein
MKQPITQYTIGSIVLLTSVLTMGYTGAAFAKKGNGSLGTKATAVDTYTSTCSKDKSGSTSEFEARIEALTKGPLVSVQIKKGAKVAKATDPKNTDTTFSPYAIIKGSGEGVYNVSVDKHGAGIVNYALQTHCKAANGKSTNQVGPKLIQNQ